MGPTNTWKVLNFRMHPARWGVWVPCFLSYLESGES